MNSKAVIIKSEFDKIIKEEIGHILEENDCTEILSDEDMQRLGAELPPKDMYDRIMKACKGVKKPKRHNIKRIFVIAAIVAALAGGTSVVANKFFGMKIRVRNDMHSVSIVEEVGEVKEQWEAAPYEETIKKAEEYVGYEIAAPEYIPEEFHFEETRIVPEESVELIFLDSDDGRIEVRQEVKFENSSTASFIDSSSINTSTEAVGSFEILFVEYVQDELEIPWITAMWSDDKMSYELYSNIEKEELKKIILSMQ